MKGGSSRGCGPATLSIARSPRDPSSSSTQPHAPRHTGASSRPTPTHPAQSACSQPASPTHLGRALRRHRRRHLGLQLGRGRAARLLALGRARGWCTRARGHEGEQVSQQAAPGSEHAHHDQFMLGRSTLHTNPTQHTQHAQPTCSTSAVSSLRSAAAAAAAPCGPRPRPSHEALSACMGVQCGGGRRGQVLAGSGRAGECPVGCLFLPRPWPGHEWHGPAWPPAAILPLMHAAAAIHSGPPLAGPPSSPRQQLPAPSSPAHLQLLGRRRHVDGPQRAHQPLQLARPVGVQHILHRRLGLCVVERRGGVHHRVAARCMHVPEPSPGASAAPLPQPPSSPSQHTQAGAHAEARTLAKRAPSAASSAAAGSAASGSSASSGHASVTWGVGGGSGWGVGGGTRWVRGRGGHAHSAEQAGGEVRWSVAPAVTGGVAGCPCACAQVWMDVAHFPDGPPAVPAHTATPSRPIVTPERARTHLPQPALGQLRARRLGPLAQPVQPQPAVQRAQHGAALAAGQLRPGGAAFAHGLRCSV